MVTAFVSGLHAPSFLFPIPQASPSQGRKFTSLLSGFSGSPTPTPTLGPSNKHFFMEFTCQQEPLGRIHIKLVEGSGLLGMEFEGLMTGEVGYGYKGSRVYAICKDEWCLLGDLLYDAPTPTPLPLTDWDPRQVGDRSGEEGATVEEKTTVVEEAKVERGDTVEGSTPRRTIHHSYRGIPQMQWKEVVGEGEVWGAVVLVASDLDTSTGVWTLGPQFKICLSHNSVRSGRTLGVVTKGLEVVERLSRLGDVRGQPENRITISDCGAC